ncbi:hypothetical protein G7046_g8714 [Stylonectria norvegica]|nr:hypothetical protein G7046_g8714 [Stylonectria norvegica]
MPLPTGLLANKSAIITGGTTGIGRAICLEFLRQGANVVVNHLGAPKDQAHLDSLIAEANILRASSTTAAGSSSVPVGRLAHQAALGPGDATARHLRL